MSSTRTSIVAVVCAIAALFAGLWLGGHPSALPEALRSPFVEDDRAVREEVIESIEDSFVEEVDRDALEDASLKGIVRSLDDRFSHYFTPRETELFEQSVSGEFDGVGMTIDEDKRGLQVLNVFDGAPAARAGIRKGDLITGVDGDSIAGEPSEIATAKIKGKPGTRVALTVMTPGSKRKRTIVVERARIEVPVARGRIKGRGGRKVGVVELLTFSSGAHGRLREEVRELLERGARGLVLDLRGNGGGLLEEGVLVASVFVEDGVVVSTEGRTKPKREYDAEGDAIDADVPVVVLVDGGSASASEIVAGALRDLRRATIVGSRTFGKGVFQELQPLSNGGALDLTVGRYYLPSGKPLPRDGLRPEVSARDRPRTKPDEALRVALATVRDSLR